MPSRVGRHWAWMFGLLASAAAAQGGEPREWLERMADAVETLNYEATFVHTNAGGIETLRVVHRYHDGVASERIVSLDGPPREIIRYEDLIICILPDHQMVLVAPRQGGGLLQSTLPDYSLVVAENYELALMQRERIAGRWARILAIRALDTFRYSFRLWLDEATAMPLRSQMLDESNNVIGEIIFTDLHLPDQISALALNPTSDTEGFSWFQQRDSKTQQSDEWRAAQVPSGFYLTAANVDSFEGVGPPVHHLVYTDGLATVSVFVEEAHPEVEWPVGPARVGSAHAYSLQIENVMVTAVGEVPAATVQMIARSLQRGGVQSAAEQHAGR